MKGLPPTFRPPSINFDPPPVEPERVREIEKAPESVLTLAEMLESPCDYRLTIEDKDDPAIQAVFGLTPNVANCNRLMRERSIPFLSVNEFAALIACSAARHEAGLTGLNVEGLNRLLVLRYAGRTLGLTPHRIFPVLEDEPCRSSSTSSDDAAEPEADASTSTETSSRTPAEDANGTPG